MVTDSIKGNISNRPYAPPSNVTAVLHRLKSHNLPGRVDAGYLRDMAIPEGTVSRTLGALRFLGLINESGQPTEALLAFNVATDEEYKRILSGLVREAYKDVFNVADPGKDAQDKIHNVFRKYGPASQRGRMVIFFLGMCREASIPTLDLPKVRLMATGQLKPVTKSVIEKSESSLERKGASLKDSSLDINPVLEGLIRSLPRAGMPLSPERRRQWLDMAEATLKFLYPESESPSSAAPALALPGEKAT